MWVYLGMRAWGLNAGLLRVGMHPVAGHARTSYRTLFGGCRCTVINGNSMLDRTMFGLANPKKVFCINDGRAKSIMIPNFFHDTCVIIGTGVDCLQRNE